MPVEADRHQLFTSIDSNVEAYGLLTHRHTPEIEQEIGAQLFFTPHLVPMSRGLLATCHARPAAGTSLSTESLLELLRNRWADEPFIVVTDGSPSTKSTLGSNAVHVTARYDERTNTVSACRSARQPHQRCVRRCGAGRQRGVGARRECRTDHDRCRTMTARVANDGAALKAATLVEALPYIRRFVGKTVVVKYGGNALAGTSEHDALALFAEDIVLMRLVGMQPVVVHGGGPQISEMMARLGKQPEFVDGLRVTDAETVDIARMVLKGQVNPQARSGHQCARQLRGRRQRCRWWADPGRPFRDPKLGFVGDVTAINPEVLQGCSTTSSSR